MDHESYIQLDSHQATKFLTFYIFGSIFLPHDTAENIKTEGHSFPQHHNTEFSLLSTMLIITILEKKNYFSLEFSSDIREEIHWS